MALPASDNFDRTDGALGANWTSVMGVSAPRIASNAVTSAVGGADSAAFWNADSFSADHWSEVKITTSNDGGPAVRCGNPSDLGQAYYLGGSSGSNAVWKFYNGSAWTQIGTAANITYTSSDVIRIEATGTTTTTIKVYKNGSLEKTVTDSSRPLSGGSAGVSVVSTTVINDWQGGNVSAAVVYTETGGATSGLTVRGVDQTTFTDAGLAIVGETIGGTSSKVSAATTYTETGMALATLTARGDVNRRHHCDDFEAVMRVSAKRWLIG